jgi:hypothetical protein
MASANAKKGAQEGADAKLVRVLEETAVHKVLERLEAALGPIVHEAVSEAIVHAMHADGAAMPKAEPRSFAPKGEAVEVKLPKEGGLCAAVWTELDKLAKKGTPELQAILKVGGRKGWNANNTRVEYYRWRQAHGISGRVAKKSEQVEARH